MFPLELVATIVAFLARDTLGATTLGLFTTSWLDAGLALPRVAGRATTSVTVGIYLFGFATAVVLLALISTLGKPFFSLLLLLSAARMVLSGYYEVGGAQSWERISGGVGIALCALAMYGGTALALEDAPASPATAALPPRQRRPGVPRANEGAARAARKRAGGEAAAMTPRGYLSHGARLFRISAQPDGLTMRSRTRPSATTRSVGISVTRRRSTRSGRWSASTRTSWKLEWLARRCRT